MPSKTRPYREALLEALADPAEAAHYLTAAMSDSPEMFLKALKNVAQANQMARVARKAGVARETLYRSLSDEGNPTLDTLRSVLGVLGLNIAVTPKVESAVAMPPVLETAHTKHGYTVQTGMAIKGGIVLSYMDPSMGSGSSPQLRLFESSIEGSVNTIVIPANAWNPPKQPTFEAYMNIATARSYEFRPDNSGSGTQDVCRLQEVH